MKYFYKKLTYKDVCQAYAEHQWDIRSFNIQHKKDTTQEKFIEKMNKIAKRINKDELHEWCVLYFG